MNIPLTDIHAALNTKGSVCILGLETMLHVHVANEAVSVITHPGCPLA